MGGWVHLSEHQLALSMVLTQLGEEFYFENFQDLYPKCRISKVVTSHAAVARSIPAEVALIFTLHEALRGYCP